MAQCGVGERWALAAQRCPAVGADSLPLQAAARHHCRYLVNLHLLQFLQAGGDPQWLRGLDYIPPKLRNLNEINKILAHRPWLITKEHIEVLKGAHPPGAGWQWGRQCAQGLLAASPQGTAVCSCAAEAAEDQ